MDNRDKIKKLELEIERLKKQQEEYDKKPDDIKLAETIHANQCRHNHVDQCSWDYETWDKIGRVRQNYLDKSRKLLEKYNPKTVNNIIKILYNL